MLSYSAEREIIAGTIGVEFFLFLNSGGITY